VSTSAYKLYKKLVNELRFRYSELEYIEQEISDHSEQFEEHYRKFCSENDIRIGELESKNKKKVDNLFSKNKVKPSTNVPQKETKTKANNDYKTFQKIYRNIAKKIHPDKFANVPKTLAIIEKEEMFKKATYAFESEKWGILMDIADSLDIHPQRYEKINEYMRDEISKVNKTIQQKKKTYNWHMSQAETEKEKDDVIISFLKHLFNYNYKK
jgi:hypothetical protein